jgi:hypothetical protein
MSPRIQAVLLVVGLSYYLLNVVLAIRRHFVQSGMSPGSLGASVPILVVLFAQPWPLWLRLILSPLVVALEFTWIAVYFVLDRFFPRPSETASHT